MERTFYCQNHSTQWPLSKLYSWHNQASAQAHAHLLNASIHEVNIVKNGLWTLFTLGSIKKVEVLQQTCQALT